MVKEGLDTEKVVALLKPGGRVHQALRGFEERTEQCEMMRLVTEGLNKKQILFLEAGTGTGKSIAYLIPSLLWALQHKERIVVSTNTITLQEQLLNKDIPALKKVLGIDIHAMLLKGMGNYLCLRKLHDSSYEMPFLSEEEKKEMERVKGWAENTADGSLSDIKFPCSSETWEKVRAESDACGRRHCDFYDRCFYFKVRERAKEAQLLVVNHHLLFADIACAAATDRKDGEGVIPKYSRLILDEAHNVEDVATKQLAVNVSVAEIAKTFARLSKESKLHPTGLLPTLVHLIMRHSKGKLSDAMRALSSRMERDLIAEKNSLLKQLHGLFLHIEEYIDQKQSSEGEGKEEGSYGKIRLKKEDFTGAFWIEKVKPAIEEYSSALKGYAQELRSLDQDFEYSKDHALIEKVKGYRVDIHSAALRLEKVAENLLLFSSHRAEDDGRWVKWVEKRERRGQDEYLLTAARLEVADLIAEGLFSRMATALLCSATLSTNNNCNFYRKRLGATEALLPDRSFVEQIFNSPFDFNKQCLLVVPKDMPSQYSPNHLRAVTEMIYQAVAASRGNAFVLFTSFRMLRMCYDLLAEPLKKIGCNSLRQGERTRQVLLREFCTQKKGVLFGTDSFWEGVDVAGETLRNVIITKLPFKVPTEPLNEARSENIARRGGSPFFEYALPQAIVKFKQGFGRLIRTKSDRGCIVCLDNRLISKPYGKMFLNSLPECQYKVVMSSELHQTMSLFYKETHYFTRTI
ncbi:DEAD/DEAH box helicase family protein [Simkania negevensis]|uniref:DNA 5'-3' helicase n=1 Tax=Simkania negevensis TaxID=83561 RepID=A0ABS3ASA6_9BACT|nr:DEAD/DEAH box helicase family protein [Simkania negevensis]